MDAGDETRKRHRIAVRGNLSRTVDGNITRNRTTIRTDCPEATVVRQARKRSVTAAVVTRFGITLARDDQVLGDRPTRRINLRTTFKDDGHVRGTPVTRWIGPRLITVGTSPRICPLAHSNLSPGTIA